MQLNLRGALKSPDETHRSIRTPTTSIAYKPFKRSEVLPASNSSKKIVYYQAPALYEKTPATTTTTSVIGSSNNRDMSSSTSTSSSSSFVEERLQFARENPSLLEPLLPHNSEQETLSSSSSPPAYSTFTTTTPTSSTIKERLSPQEEKISPELKEEQVDQTPPAWSADKGKENELVSPELIVGQFDRAAGPSQRPISKRKAKISAEIDAATFDQTPPQTEEQQLSTSSQSWSGDATESFKSIPATGSYSAPSSPVRSIHRQVLNILGKGKVLPSTARRMEQSRTELFSAIREQGQRRSRKQLFAELRDKRNVQLRNKLFNEIRERRIVQQRNKLFSEIRDRKMTEMRNKLFAEIRNRKINQLRKAMLAEIRDRRATQLRNKLFSEIRDRRTTQLRNKLFSEIRDRRMTQMRNKLFSEIRERRATQLRNKLFSEIRERNTNQLRKAMLAEIRDRRAAHLREKLFAEIRDRRAMQLRENLFAEIRNRKTNQLHDKLLSEIRDWKTTQLRQKLFSEIRERKTAQLRNELLSEIRERKTAKLREKLFSDIRNRKTDQLRKSLLAEIHERKGSNLPSALRQQRALLFAEILQRKVFTSPRTQRLRSALFKEIIERQPFEPASPHTSKLREELFKEIRQRNPVGGFKSIPASASGGSYSAPSSPVRSIHRKVLNILGKGKALPSEARRMERGESWSQAEPEVTFIITMEPTRTTEMIEKEAPAIRPKHQMRRASHPAVHPIRKKFIEPMLLAEKEEEERLAKLEEDRSMFLRSQTSTSSSASQLPEPVQPSAPIQAPFEAVQIQLSEPIQTPVRSIETTSSVLPEEKSLPLMPEVPETIPTAALGQTESISESQKDMRSMYNLPAQESTVSIRRNSIIQIPSTSGTSTPLNIAQATPHQLPPVYEPGCYAAETVTTAPPVSSISPATPEIDIEAGVNVVPIVAPIITSPASQSNVEIVSSISEEPISSRATSFIAPTSLNAPVGVHELTKLPQADLYDVIIVGGGLSGLAAAYKLTSMVDLGITPRVLLLESSNRLGGRLETMPLANTQELLDLGAMWIPGEHQTVWKLAAELGLEYYPNMQMGSNILQHGNKLKMFNGSLSEAFHAFGKKNTNSLFTKINKIAQSMSEHHPFLEKNSVNFDKLSVYAWSRKEAWSKETTEALDLMVESIFGCKSTDISMLYFLYNIRTCNVDIRRLWQIAVGYQCYRLSGGVQALTDGLAQKITAAGVKTVLNANVLSIVQQNENNVSATEEFTSAIVSTSQGTFYGKNVIFAASPKATAAIEFSPPLPPIRQQLPQRLHTNRWIRAFAVYDAPFWRESGYSGQVFIYSSLIDREPISFVYEASTMSGLKSGSYVLCASIVGERAAYWGAKSPNDRRIAVLSKLGSLFGPRALQAKYFVDQDWGKDQYARGGSFTVFPPGAMSACFGGIKQPHYQIHWAATETANEWQGYIEGACQSGFRAATEVADRLAHQLIVEKAPIVSTVVEETTTASVASLGQLKPTGGFSNIPTIAPNVVTMNQR